MNTNRNIPYNYNVKDIDWPGLKAVGISKEQLEADGNLALLVPGDNNRAIMEINGIRQEESPKK